MKIPKLILLIIICLFAPTLKAQDTTYNRRLGLVLKTDILNTVLSEALTIHKSYSLSVEKLIGKKQSFQLSGYFDYFHYNSNSHTSFRSFQITPEYRFYLNKKNWHKGIYCGIYSGLLDQHDYIPNGSYSHKIRFIELGAISGYQIYLFKHVAVDFVCGLGAKKIIYDRYVTKDGLHSNQRLYYIDGRLSFNIGYIFY